MCDAARHRSSSPPDRGPRFTGPLLAMGRIDILRESTIFYGGFPSRKPRLSLFATTRPGSFMDPVRAVPAQRDATRISWLTSRPVPGRRSREADSRPILPRRRGSVTSGEERHDEHGGQASFCNSSQARRGAGVSRRAPGLIAAALCQEPAPARKKPVPADAAAASKTARSDVPAAAKKASPTYSKDVCQSFSRSARAAIAATRSGRLPWTPTSRPGDVRMTSPR